MGTGGTSFIIATGGTVSTDGDYIIHTFNNSGSFVVDNAPTNLTLEYLVVAGGGGGGTADTAANDGAGGGGGAGGILSGTLIPTAQTYTITVGAGGLGGGAGANASYYRGANGQNSIFGHIVAIGGGGGGADVTAKGGRTGLPGGSGGGGGALAGASGTAGAGTIGQGNDGGAGVSDTDGRAGGGGGAGGAGISGSSTTNRGGNGGIGIVSTITGTSVYYAGGGGGGGGISLATRGIGGLGGGANAAYFDVSTGENGLNNLGGGGGGSMNDVNGGNGGSGVIILRYQNQGILSIPNEPSGSVDTVNNSYSALKYVTYSSYFSDNVNFFDSGTPSSTGNTNTITAGVNEFESTQWTGYLYNANEGNYYIQTISDDASYVWIGSNAVSGYTTTNATVNNGGEHAPQTIKSSPIYLSGGKYYPIRVQFGNNSLEGQMEFYLLNSANTPVSTAFAFNTATALGFNS